MATEPTESAEVDDFVYDDWTCGDCDQVVGASYDWCPNCDGLRVDESDHPKGVAYISGPMRGYPNFNYDYFDKVESKLIEEGWTVFNPARHFGGDQGREWSEYMYLDIKDVLDCDAIFVLPGWQDSEGARLEVQVAQAVGKEVRLVDSATATLPAELEAASMVRNGKRQASYGHPSQDFLRTSKIWSGILGVDVSPLQVALCMAGLKISRLVGTPQHRDSLVDAHGYFTCYERILDHGDGS